MVDKPILTETTSEISNDFTPVNFESADQFDQLINSKGYNVYIDRALKCPCTSPNIGQPLTDCLNCGGTGWFFVDREKTKALMLRLNSNKKQEQWSETNMGKASITLKYTNDLSFMDRFVVTDLLSTYSQNLKPFTKNGKIYAFTIYDVKEVLHCYCFSKTDQKLSKLIVEKDFKLESNKLILSDSFSTRINDENFCISVRYTHYPVYHVIDFLREFARSENVKADNGELQMQEETKAHLPLNFMAIKAHYILDTQNLSANKIIENTRT